MQYENGVSKRVVDGILFKVSYERREKERYVFLPLCILLDGNAVCRHVEWIACFRVIPVMRLLFELGPGLFEGSKVYT